MDNWYKTSAVSDKPRRPVKIDKVNDTWMILYPDRTKRRHYSPAQFYAPDHTREEVVQWAIDHGFDVVNPQEVLP